MKKNRYAADKLLMCHFDFMLQFCGHLLSSIIKLIISIPKQNLLLSRKPGFTFWVGMVYIWFTVEAKARRCNS